MFRLSQSVMAFVARLHQNPQVWHRQPKPVLHFIIDVITGCLANYETTRNLTPLPFHCYLLRYTQVDEDYVYLYVLNDRRDLFSNRIFPDRNERMK